MILTVIVVAVLVVIVLSMGRLAWRVWRGNEEMVPGGSMGRQMFGRTKDRKRKRRRG